jgi:signal transduction histidine kinase
VTSGFTCRVRANAALRRAADALAPHVESMHENFRRQLGQYDARQRKALIEITPGAAARLLVAGKSVAQFLEQVDYNGRRLAKLNVSPAEVLKILAAYDRLRPHHGLESLNAAVVLALNNAYYRVREAEAQAFFDLFRVELEAANLNDLLSGFAPILSRTFRARAARLYLGRRDTERRFIEAGTPAEAFILDESWRGRYRSYWSIPFFAQGEPAGLIQLAFATRYDWLPRELELLDAVAERCLAAAEKARLTAEVRDLAAHMFQVEEEERRRISRDLHDEAGQTLLLARLQLEMLERIAPATWEGRAKLTQTREVVERTIAEIRRILAALSPAVLEQLGLAAAVRQLTTRLHALCPAQVKLRITLPGRLERNVETVAYRLVQECYHNIARHSGASHVKVLLRSTDCFLGMRIEDNGVGFNLDAAMAQRNSFGLAGMRERVTLIGGRFEIRSEPGKGTTVAIRLPLRQPSIVERTSAQKGNHGQNSSFSYR